MFHFIVSYHLQVTGAKKSAFLVTFLSQWYDSEKFWKHIVEVVLFFLEH